MRGPELRRSTTDQIVFALLWVAVLLLLFSCLMLVTLNYWGIRLGAIDYQKFGSWGQVVSGSATFLGVMTALVSLVWQFGKNRKEQEQKSIDEQTAVYFWLTSQVVKEDVTDLVRGRQWDLEIQNLTKAPIYVWRVEAEGRPLVDTQRPILPNQNTFNVPLLDDREPSQIPEPVLYFVSREGGYWRRSATGSLTALSQFPRMRDS
ncbi:hypothetical protein IF803_28675 [Bradyrhizobium sp. UFLA06-06]